MGETGQSATARDGAPLRGRSHLDPLTRRKLMPSPLNKIETMVKRALRLLVNEHPPPQRMGWAASKKSRIAIGKARRPCARFRQAHGH